MVKSNPSNSPRLALKRCKLDHDREYRAAIVRELRIMSTGHYNLIKLKEASIFKNEVWIAMDLMRCSVFAILCSRALPEELAIYIGKEVNSTNNTLLGFILMIYSLDIECSYIFT
jgi:hypothetical protein